jgi:hypothetical protein
MTNLRRPQTHMVLLPGSEGPVRHLNWLVMSFLGWSMRCQRGAIRLFPRFKWKCGTFDKAAAPYLEQQWAISSMQRAREEGCGSGSTFETVEG